MTLNIVVTVENDVPRRMGTRVARMERAVKTAVAGATLQLKTAWRQDVAAKLGARLGNAVRAEVYPEGQDSLNAAGLVFTRAPKVIGAHERGAVIRAQSGTYLAIPLPAAGPGRLTPAEWQFRTGRKLQLVPAGPGRRYPMLVTAGGARLNTGGRAVASKRRRRKDGVLTGETTIPVFVLVRQVKLPKRLNLKAAALSAGTGLPGRIRSAIGAAI